MLRLLNKWRERRAYRALVEEARNDWVIVHTGLETDRNGTVIARYVCEQSGLGERRVRVIWKYYDALELASPRYTEWLIWVERAEHRIPPRHEVEVW